MQLITAGESHGKCLVGVIEGYPSGVKLDTNKINEQLRRRMCGYGRGGRMSIESDSIELLSGVRGGITIGSPIAFSIANRDYENRKAAMDPVYGDLTAERLTAVRPGHADFSGMLKYGFDNARNVLERASARETAVRVAAGAICRAALDTAGIEVFGAVTSIGGKVDEEGMHAAIDAARAAGDTLGGRACVTVRGMPIGVGSYVHFDRKLDAVLAMHLMSIQSVKAVGIGLGDGFADLFGSAAHDEIFVGGRRTNNAGGIEGGMSNGEEIVCRVTFKPIPTLMKGLRTIDTDSGKEVTAASERSDVCAVEAATVVAENVVSFAILNELLKTFGGDRIDELTERIKTRKEQCAKRL